MKKRVKCPLCGNVFVSLQKHISKNMKCKESMLDSFTSSKRHKISFQSSRSCKEKLSFRNENTTYANNDTYHPTSSFTNNDVVKPTTPSQTLEPLNLSQVCKELFMSSKNPILSTRHMMSMELFRLLHKAKAPISLYKDIGSLISKYSRVIRNSKEHIIIPRCHLINEMHQFICLEKKSSSTKPIEYEKDYSYLLDVWKFDLSPKHVKLQLSDCNISVSVPKFDFVSAFLNIMHDPSIVGESQNLLYNLPEYLDPNNKQKSIHSPVDYIFHGSWYKDTHNLLISDTKKELICPIILYVDGVSIDNGGRKSLEPISFTLGWFSKQIRNMQKCWRVLGYIPNVEKTTSMDYKDEFGNKKKDVIKKSHYHEIIQCILSELHDVQKRGGIRMILPFQSCMKEVLVKFPIAFIVGDTIGNDKLCSRYQNYTPTQLENTGVSRDCICTYKYAGKHNYKCNILSRKTVKSLPSDVSRRLGFDKSTFNAFDDMCFGASRHGINGHTPPEMLHQWYLGVLTMFIKYFLEHITSKCKDTLDLMVQNMSRISCRQSDRSLPNIGLFRNGIDKVKLTGSEKGTQLFMLWLVLIPKNHGICLIDTEMNAPAKYKLVASDIKKGRTSRIYEPKILDTWKKYHSWINIFESMLSIGEWLRSSSVSIDRRDIEPRHSIELFMLHGYDAWQNNIVSTQNEMMRNNRVIDFSEVEVHDTTSYSSTIRSFQDPNVFTHHDVFTCKKATIKVSRADVGIRVFMKQCREVINEEDISILKNGKFHQLLHYTYYIHSFGCPANFDGSIPESMNKEFAKNTGKRTQQRNETINQQCAERFYENNIIDSSWNKMNNSQKSDSLKITEMQPAFEGCYDVSGTYTFTFNIIDDEVWTYTNHCYSNFNQYVLTKSKYIFIDFDTNMLNVKYSNRIRMTLMTTLVLTLIRNNVITRNLIKCTETKNSINQLTCYSHIKLLNDLTIHSALEYYSEDNWIDWALVDWGDEGGVLPCKVLCLFDARNVINGIKLHSQKEANHSSYISSLLECSIWCLVRSASSMPSPSEKKTPSLFSRHKMANELCIVTIDSVICGAYVLDMSSYIDKNVSRKKDEEIMNRLFDMNHCTEIITIRNRNEWCKTFMEKSEPFERFKTYVEKD